MIAESWTLGLDLGGTGMRAVATGAHGELLGRVRTSTPSSLNGSEAIDLIRSLSDRLVRGAAPSAIGIGASGPIDDDGIIQNPDTLPAFTGLDLPRLLGNAFAAPVVIDNDAVTAALAEGMQGAAAGWPAHLHITLGTGVGVCNIVAGRPMRGADGIHPEAGHLGVTGWTPPCYCGRARCWEQGASRSALQRAAAAASGLAPDDTRAISAARRAALIGDPDASAVFSAWAEVLADGLTSLINALRPPLVILGGSAALALDVYRAPLVNEISRLAAAPVPEIRATALDDYGGAIGATLLVPRQ